jgi:hypothetical protein
MQSKNALLGFSRTAAVLFGLSLPLAETARRWGKVDYWPALLDDWCIGLFLLVGVWATETDAPSRGGRTLLAAAWGFTCGLGYASFFGHLRTVDQPDVGPLPHALLTTVIGFGWLVAILAMFATVFANAGGAPSDDS